MINNTAAAKPTHSGTGFSPPLLPFLLRSRQFIPSLVISRVMGVIRIWEGEGDVESRKGRNEDEEGEHDGEGEESD